MSKRTLLSCAGVIADAESRTIFIGGRMAPVTCVSYLPATPELPGTERLKVAEDRYSKEFRDTLLKAIYKSDDGVARALSRPVPAMPEVLHFTVVCENGWWIDVHLYPEDGEVGWDDPRQKYDEFQNQVARTPWDLLAFIDEVSSRPQFIPTEQEIEEHGDNPHGGYDPGHWDVDDFGDLPD